jgi:heme exporter protein A
LDEPFNALDIQAVHELQDLMIEHLSTGGLIVFTSHQVINIPNMQVLEL